MSNLDAIILVGYRVNSVRAIQFRQWATRVLHDAVLTPAFRSGWPPRPDARRVLAGRA
jgi:hypothetical protein